RRPLRRSARLRGTAWRRLLPGELTRLERAPWDDARVSARLEVMPDGEHPATVETRSESEERVGLAGVDEGPRGDIQLIAREPQRGAEIKHGCLAPSATRLVATFSVVV